MKVMGLEKIRRFYHVSPDKEFVCDFCGHKYKIKDSNASYMASFCSANCEKKYTDGWK